MRAVVGSGTPVVEKMTDPAVPMVNVGVPIAPMVGAWSTCSENDCVALGATPLVAMIVRGYVPPEPEPGVPERTPPDVKLTPLGRALAVLNVGAGDPFAVTLKLPLVPTTNVVVAALVKLGARLMLIVIGSVVGEPIPLEAVTVQLKVPPEPADAVPESTPALLKAIAAGSVGQPESAKVGAGKPVAV